MEDELVQLDSVYKAPGFLLLAVGDDGSRLGCIGARALPDAGQESWCEVRRLFVRQEGRGLGLGRLLADKVIGGARAAGFDRLVLNTLPAMAEAIELYRSVGFSETEPYVDEPIDEVIYFALDL